MYDRPPLILGDQQAGRDGHCSFGVPDPVCNKPAEWHIWWLHDDTVSQSCDEHLDYLAGRDTDATPYESHPYCSPCGEAGTYWLHQTSERVGYCFHPADDPAELLASVQIGGE